MIWSRLKNNCCPGCASLLQMGDSLLTPFFNCSNVRCVANDGKPFLITEERFNEIIEDMYRPKERQSREYDNMSALNNLGHEVRSEDFSDKQPV